MSESREALRRQQHLLAKALTNRNARNAIGQDSVLAGLDREELERSAETLVRKRLSQTRAILRGTSSLLGESFALKFRLFAETHFYNGPDAIWQDAVEFSRWLTERCAGPECLGPECLKDVIQWERQRCWWEHRRWHVALFRLNYAVGPWLAGPNLSGQPQPMKHWVWMWRFGAKRGLRVVPRFTSPRS